MAGFSGERCEVNIDDCVGHRCENGATCVDGVGDYECACRPEYTGRFCTEDVDECAVHQGICQGHNSTEYPKQFLKVFSRDFLMEFCIL